MKGFRARVQEIVGRAAERAEVSLERVLRELKAIAKPDASIQNISGLRQGLAGLPAAG
jgi:hypothetical protein